MEELEFKLELTRLTNGFREVKQELTVGFSTVKVLADVSLLHHTLSLIQQSTQIQDGVGLTGNRSSSILTKSLSCPWMSNLSSKLGQIGPKWDKSGIFQTRFYTFWRIDTPAPVLLP